MEQRFGRLVITAGGQGLYPITDDIRAWVAQQGISRGLLTLWCRHTSASLLVQANADPEVLADLEAFFQRLVPEGRGLYRHEDEALDNMPAHIRAALTQTSISIPVQEAVLMLGEFQEIYLFEHRRGAPERSLDLHLMGEP
jgi:secondary thiamine-phosphate synthase enzyme